MGKRHSQQKRTVAVFGFSDEMKNAINICLTGTSTVMFDTECAPDLLAMDHLMIIVNTAETTDDDLEMLLGYYNEISSFSETVILIGETRGFEVNRRISVYSEFDELLKNMKYLLLSASKQKKSAESFSRSVSYALLILKLITENPGISSKEISERLEISPRTVIRYIETLNMSGESIVYSRKENGWRLQYNESLLKF